MRYLLAFIWILSALPVFAGALLNPENFRMKTGDDPAYASPGHDDRDWTLVQWNAVPETGGIVWLRARILLGPEHIVPGHPVGIFIAALASHEIYWDGELIGRGGLPAQISQEETPGPIQAHYAIPDRLARPGGHVPAIRASAHHRHFRPMTGYWNLVIGDYDRFVDAGRATTTVSLISLNGLILMAVFAFLLFIVDRGDRSYLLLSLLALIAAALLVAEGWRNLFGYTYDRHILRLIAVVSLSALWNLTLVLFVIARFPGSRARVFVILAVAGIFLSLLARSWDGKALLTFLSGLPLSLIWTLRAVERKRRGSIPAAAGLTGLLLVLIWQPTLFADRGLYFGIDFLMLCMLAAHVQQVRQERMEREEARLKSARLEIELLKKHIQPHYLLNTLTALSEWIEQEPKEAVKMIHALSEEFRILSGISHCRTIPLEEEVRLCRSHLEIMSFRKGMEYRLTSSGVTPGPAIPPAVLHTVVENAVVHNRPEGERMEIRLNTEQQDGYCRIVVIAPMGARETLPEPERREGTGFRYIRARMQECYASDWTFDSGPHGEFWRTELRFPRPGQECAS